MKNSFTRIIMTSCLMLSLSGIIFPQYHHNNEDRKSPAINERKEELLNKIKEKLDDLDTEYLSQLNRREYSRAKRDLHKIYGLIEAVKNQQMVEEDPPVTAMQETDYRQLVNSINNESFEDNKLSVLRSSAKYSYFSVEQIIGLMDLSSFSSWKLKALDISYPFVVDKNNTYKIINALTFQDDKQKAQEIIDRY